MTNILKKILGDFFIRFAVRNSDCACFGPTYQPEEPEALKRYLNR